MGARACENGMEWMAMQMARMAVRICWTSQVIGLGRSGRTEWTVGTQKITKMADNEASEPQVDNSGVEIRGQRLFYLFTTLFDLA